MGQKIHPHGLRVGIIKDWDSRWFVKDEQFSETLLADYELRKFLKKRLNHAGVPNIEIERSGERVHLVIHTAKPGIIIGRGGSEIEKLKVDVEKFIGKHCTINVVEIKQPDTNALLVAENIAAQLEKRISFRRAMKQAISKAIRLNAKGIKVMVSGRLRGAERSKSVV